MRLHFLIAALAAVALAPPSPAFAYHNGIAGYSGMDHGLICTACHSGGKVPLVAFSGPAALAPGATGEFTFTVTSTAPLQTAAGFNVAANGGKLAVTIGQSEQLCDPGTVPCGNVGNELTHTKPKPNDASGQAAWTFKWTAPSVAGSYTLWGAGNSVHVDSDPSDDKAAGTTLMVAVGAVATPTPEPPTDTPTPGTTDTPTSTPLPEVTATSAPTDSPTFTATDTATPTAIPTPTASVSATAPATSTATPAGTAMPTPRGQPGDANCDGALTVSDVSAEVAILSGEDFGCGGSDTDGDGVVDTDDVPALLQLLFEPLTR